MPVFLRYKHTVGEVQRTQQDVVVTYEQPQSDPLVGKMRVLVETTVLEVHPDQTWTLSVNAQMQEQEGYLPPYGDGSVQLRVNDMGEVLSASGPYFLPFMVFPSGPVIKKFGWKADETCVGRTVTMEHSIKSLEPIDSDTEVHIVSEGKTDSDPAMHFLAVRVFSSKQGKFLLSECAVNLTWSSGVQFSATVDERQP